MVTNFDDIQEHARGFMVSRILLTAIELDLFTKLGKKKLTIQQIAKLLKTSFRGTDILLHALSGLGYLNKQNNRFRNASISHQFLDKSSSSYRGGILRHHSNLWQNWSHLTQVMKTGKPVRTEIARRKDAVAGRDFIWGMYHGGWENAVRLAELLDLSGVTRMLDLGGGPGSYAIAFAKKNPKLNTVVFDLPYALQVAKEIIIQHKMQTRIQLKPGDFLKNEIGKNYDLVLMSQIIHSYSEKQNQQVIKKVYRSLVSGGKIVIHEFFLDQSRTKPASAAVFAINMLVNTTGGRTYTHREVSGWLKRVGFSGIKYISVSDRSALLMAKKPVK
ncbi:MAG: methyltransferase [bacterium]|nr:methyltransferase [bacterium]